MNEALKIAENQNLDLVEISPQAKPPVVKLINWGKYRYEQDKLQQKSRKKQKNVELKQIRLGLKTDHHDLDVKFKAAQKFLDQGHKIRVNLRFKGREITHPELGQGILDNFFNRFENGEIKEQEPTLTGRELSMIIMRKKNAKT